MPLNQEQLTELNLLLAFDLDSMHQGVKVSSHEAPKQAEAMARLHAKGIVTEVDGGYLTHMGIEAAERAHKLCAMLKEGY
ncbi:hypothetical protein VST7929_01058 [Vibrio stylophorae]|uniref:TIGR02647 family protein n=1 Tax=Vibrio stylophorae TaxID=659351 RepID=A0ABM8ZSB3_9VIBR|nr:TIGR02647 family protein [Vibrio stylophorae]CAH0533196.1 hypothetical protein VST7929_01058 [Vibrio stylophorae]